MRPVADFVRQLQSSISLWLDNPAGWTKQPEDDDERQTVINEFRKMIYVRVHILAEQRLVTDNLPGWQLHSLLAVGDRAIVALIEWLRFMKWQRHRSLL